MYDWEGQAVLDRAGEKIGKIEEIFLVEDTGRPEWALVKVGRLKGHTTLVPLRSAYQSADGVKVSVPKDVVEDAPAIKNESELSESQVEALYRHYGLDSGNSGQPQAAATNGNGSFAASPPASSPSANPPAGGGFGRFSAPPQQTQVVRGAQDPREQAVGDLLQTVKEEAPSLARQHAELAKAEMIPKAKQVGIGAGMFGGAGYVAHLAGIALMLCIIFALAEFMAPWLAALIVTVLYAAIAGALAMSAKKRIQNAGPPIPEQTVESVKQTIETVKEEAKWGLGQTR